MKPLIKWPGGKTGEIGTIEKYIPEYKRYIEPFFGGGALFFYLRPERAVINDISNSLIEYYEMIKNQDEKLYELLLCYSSSFSKILEICNERYIAVLEIFKLLSDGKLSSEKLRELISGITIDIVGKLDNKFTEKLLLDRHLFVECINKAVIDKLHRTVKNNAKKTLNDEDLKDNIITGFTSGYYMYFRDVYNSINLNKITAVSAQYKIANFYFVREYCYGSMFRYNANGEFNIPYGGLSYNYKNFKKKIDNMFNSDVRKIFENTDIHCCDFEAFIRGINLTNDDFVFLDPPYDTDFSDYEGNSFTKADQERLAALLKQLRANFILVIKNTDFIYNLYGKDFNTVTFDNQYTYNVRSRNKRDVKHLIITNLPL